MKKIAIISVCMLFCYSFLLGQTVKITKEPVKIGKPGEHYSVAQLSPDGKNIAVSNANLKGLNLLDAQGNFIRVLNDEESAGWKFSWSPDSRKIAFRSNRISQQNKETFITIIGLDGKILTQTNAVQNASLPFWNLTGSTVAYHQDDNNWKKLIVGKNNAATILYAGNRIFILPEMNSNAQANVTLPGEIINTAVSPSGSKYCIEVAGSGLYVYDTANNAIIDLGPGEYPQWINDEYFVYMLPKDDGYRMLSSDIYVKKYNGNDATIITGNFPGIALYPSASRNGQVVFTTDTEELYTVTISIK